ncbi:Uncharacterised protein [Helicobacter cholecystus]|uniref:outer membrane beta-barrel protein n=1 Tax=Helicobacter cholecystus TaxID=45498 RepID=UPI000CF1AF58|nr:outer membrane beta-barrel protein [Helicobacter cholecystus]VEJ24741.1 Uncharacterised protein [Helicobacter cholecystus]
MKKLLLTLCLIFGIVNAEDITSNSDIGQWRTFIGVEGGVGLYSIVQSIALHTNTYLGGKKPYADSLGYNLALQVGWQKYYSEHFGKRFILSLRGDYMQNYGKYDDGDKQFPLGNGYGFMFSFITDWLFDFSVQDKKRYGMFVGLGIDVLGLDWIQKASNRLGVALSFVARFGFKAQIENDVFDITLNIPTFGLASGPSLDPNWKFGDFLNVPINSTLTLGYKHLF